jgi:hypothetical protein
MSQISYIWKDKTCDTCDQEIDGLCRAVPPRDGEYEAVVLRGSVQMACKLWEPKREEPQ